VAEAIGASPAEVDAVVAHALPGAEWRAVFGIEEPGAALGGAVADLSSTRTLSLR
jgi:adenine/guanine phosphoribosyltransferase-like PRPP-binding protein